MLRIKNLFLRYTREFYALYDITMEIGQGENVAFIGEENSGKTSLLRILTKLEKPTKGAVYINDRPLNKVDFKSDISIGYIPATPVFLEKKTVYENLKYILKQRKMSKEDLEKKINQAIIDFSLEKIRDEKICNLSLEEKYILSFIRLTFRELDMLLIDNIFDNLSEVYVDIIQDMIKRLKGKNTTLILATTSEEIANNFGCKKKFHFVNGSIEGQE